MKGFVPAVLTTTILAVAGAALTSAQTGTPAPTYVGLETCSGCHASAAKTWSDSHHAWALRAAEPGNVLADFDDASFEHGGSATRFFRRDGRYYVKTDGPDGKPVELEIKYTVGVEPLQQYLVELDRGRLQALDIAWDTERERWYHLYPDQILKPGDGLRWSGPYKNWQARCAECHQTNFVKAYSPRTRSYKSSWSDLTVACEACHGPGEAHVAWARAPGTFDPTRFEGVDAKGMTLSFRKAAPQNELQLCARCHSRREPLGADSPPPSEAFADHYNLALLRPGLYHPDGQIDDEVYVHGSFLQSKMYERGVRCTNCHEAHSAELKAAGNALCTQCHNETGNPDFPTLKPADYDAPGHHRHKQNFVGAQCVSCHMPAKTYMGIDGRRDHSFRVPRPDLSVALGTPNACSGCHDDKPASWAAARVAEWYPDGRKGDAHFAQVFARARSGRIDRTTVGRLLEIARGSERPAIVRATALDHLRVAVNAKVLSKVSGLLRDDSALVRAAAARLHQSAPGQAKFARLMPLIEDRHKSVRISAARQLVTVPPERFPTKARAKVNAAVREYQASLLAKTDYPEIQMALAGLAMATRNLRAAEAALNEALRMDPQLANGWHLLARLQLADNRPADARRSLNRGLELLPDTGELHHLLGNVLVQHKQDGQAIRSFQKAAELLPADLGIRVDLALALTRRGEHGNASAVIEEARRLSPASPDVLALTATNRLERGDIAAARDAARELVRLHPRYPLPPQLRALVELP